MNIYITAILDLCLWEIPHFSYMLSGFSDPHDLLISCGGGRFGRRQSTYLLSLIIKYNTVSWTHNLTQ
jgi:hypothetical protein